LTAFACARIAWVLACTAAELAADALVADCAAVMAAAVAWSDLAKAVLASFIADVAAPWAAADAAAAWARRSASSSPPVRLMVMLFSVRLFVMLMPGPLTTFRVLPICVERRVGCPPVVRFMKLGPMMVAALAISTDTGLRQVGGAPERTAHTVKIKLKIATLRMSMFRIYISLVTA